MSTVQFVGAGPGSADLITVRGLRAIEQADCILYDALIDLSLLDSARSDAVKIAVGKRAGKASTEQNFINRLLVSSAQQYPRVVRLKGGDPSIFGRLDEELAALDEVGVEYSIVPGVTSACAAAATIKRPLTQRGVARKVMFATPAIGRQVDEPNQAIESLSPQQADTLALYMAGKDRAAIAQRLIQQGWATDTPVALVWNAGSQTARTQNTTLIDMAWIAGAEQFDQPLMILVGRAVAVSAAVAGVKVPTEASIKAITQSSANIS
jgi:uroporphyrin-III C-methyltransferase